MDVGMLWLCSSNAPLADHVRRAADYYADKYGQVANACFVHPSMLTPDGAPVTVGVIRVRPSRTVLKGHLWLGVESETNHATNR